MSVKTLYRHLKLASDIPIRCPLCNEPMTVHHFYHHHALENHRLQSRKQCLFCKGEARWAYGEKNRPDNVKHVVECLKRFVIIARDESPGMEDETEEEEEEEEEVTSAEVCECKTFVSIPHQMLGRRKERMNEYVGFMIPCLKIPTGGDATIRWNLPRRVVWVKTCTASCNALPEETWFGVISW
ncbi:hypothetical protein NPIL_132071 [Nephila pilipes]|uniref:Uncharacterized protein n=1 Tax=Nephila pilipes TaxID=299642 RepID=A0A8X6PBW7_NEPPI|nr:hypothetical protein NPIL_132071 [Nephila pilipes]